MSPARLACLADIAGLNIGDFSRYCKHPKSVYVQVWALPAIFSLMSVFGSITAACCKAIYGVPLYQAYEIIDKWDGSPGGRAAMFFASAIWSLAIITTNMFVTQICFARPAADPR
jgi:NCS1 family nucleobase:cation symporter-1